MAPADELKVGLSSSSNTRKGGWVTFPFIIGIVGGTGLAFGGLTSNLIVYLIQEFNIKSISAAKIYNVINGFGSLLPIAAAILVDSFLGCFSVIWISALISSLGMLVVTLTGAISGLRPPPCGKGGNVCVGPTPIQLTVLYLGLGLASLGIAGTRFTIGPMGAHQFDQPNQQQTFFNWYAFVMYTCGVISAVAIVYVQTNVSWAWGFGISLAANAFGLALFLAGNRFFRHLNPQGNPFASLTRVVIAAVRKRRINFASLSNDPRDYCQDPENRTPDLPSRFFRFLNRAALITKEETGKSRRICTVSEGEDLKTLIKMFPIWLSAVIVTIPIVILLSFVVLQALTMDRRIGHNFDIPAGTMGVFLSLSTCITILLIERVLIPVWIWVSPRHPITPLQRIGIGHVLDVLSMAALALAEAKRLNSAVPVSVFWLIPSLVLNGMGEAFLFPGHIAFFYQDFPKQLKSTSTAIISLSIGVAFYAGNGLIDVVRRSTDWLPDDINEGRLDNFYWLVAALGSLNFCYFLTCAWFYKYRNVENIDL